MGARSCSGQEYSKRCCAVWLFQRYCWNRRRTEGYTKGINVPFRGALAMHPDLTTVQLDDALAEGEMEASPTPVSLQIVRTKFENVSALL